MASKRNLVANAVREHARRALLLHASTIADAPSRAYVVSNAAAFARAIADEIERPYNFLELADIMEWKTRRVSR